jgi:outer membrane immunogenic protein
MQNAAFASCGQWPILATFDQVSFPGHYVKKLLLAGIAAAALCAAPALAADMPVKTPAAASAFNWSGFYVGGHVGGAWGHFKATDLDAYYALGAVTTLDSNGIFGGGTLGYNFQTGSLVLGIEADLGGMDIGKATSPAGAGAFPGAQIGIKSGFYGDVTGRLGYAWGQTLLYAKGGWAFFDGGDQFFQGAGAAFTSRTTPGTFNGWTLGGGFEYAINPAWSVKLEYLHFEFGDQTFGISALGLLFRFREELKVDTIKFGLNYRFGGDPWGKSPVVAKY